MANSKTNEFEEYVKGLLECPICSEPMKLTPIHQCTNGHVVCTDCITKQEGNCQICRNNSTIARNLVFEQIIKIFRTPELSIEESSEKPELQILEKGSVGASFSNNQTNAEPSVKLNLQTNLYTKESAENGGFEFEEYIKGLLECPVCIEPIKSTPIHQCTNGHVHSLQELHY